MHWSDAVMEDFGLKQPSQKPYRIYERKSKGGKSHPSCAKVWGSKKRESFLNTPKQKLRLLSMLCLLRTKQIWIFMHAGRS